MLNAQLALSENDLIKGHSNHVTIEAKKLDFDELCFMKNTVRVASPEEHEKGFNIYEVPFPNLKLELAIEDLNYHRYKIKDFIGTFRIQQDHYVYIDTLSLDAAGGNITMRGYFNGSNPKLIYFSPSMKLTKVNLDELLVKFENFGQDYLVSENLHGRLSGDLWGKIHMHKDMVPIVDDSEIHLDFNVLSDKLENFGPMEYLAEYFADKNVAKVISHPSKSHRHQDGVLNIPTMQINTSLNSWKFLVQNNDFSYEYYLKVPWKMITKAGASKLFKKKKRKLSTLIKRTTSSMLMKGKKFVM